MGIKTTVDKIWFCKGQRVPSVRYKENYERIRWNSERDTDKKPVQGTIKRNE